MRRAEDSLQIGIVQWLRLHGYFVTHVPNASKRGAREGARLKKLGMVAGYPDLIVHGRGGFTALIELKPPPKVLKSGKLSKAKPRTSEAQDDVAKILAPLGIPVLVARSIEDVAKALKGMEMRV